MTRPPDFSNSNLKIGKSAPEVAGSGTLFRKLVWPPPELIGALKENMGLTLLEKEPQYLSFVSVMINRAFGATGTASAFSSRRRKHRFDLDQRRLALIERRLQRLGELLFCFGSVTG